MGRTVDIPRGVLEGMIQDEMTMAQAARELGCCDRTVSRAARRYGLRFLGPGKRQRDPTHLARVIDLVRRGCSTGAAVARVVGLTPAAVQRTFAKLEREGILARLDTRDCKRPGWHVTRRWVSEGRDDEEDNLAGA